MAKFLRESVRLYTHTTEAYRLFTNKKSISKWNKNDFLVHPKVGGEFEIKWEVESYNIFSTGTIFLDYEREKRIKLLWKDDFCFSNRDSIVEIYIMQATQYTEYCTEIHVVHSGLETLTSDEVDVYRELWNQILASIHKSINNGWEILDSELDLSCLRG